MESIPSSAEGFDKTFDMLTSITTGAGAAFWALRVAVPFFVVVVLVGSVKFISEGFSTLSTAAAIASISDRGEARFEVFTGG